MLGVVQVAINTVDMPGSLRFYSEAFGFRNAGGQCNWGKVLHVQGLGEEGRGLLWWLTGRQDFFQLELFHYTEPKQRPMAADWRASDHGWTRIGVAVADFDGCMAIVARDKVTMMGCSGKKGARRAAIRDPFAGMVIEIIEIEGDPAEGPEVVYATSSVSDLESAREFYANQLGFEILPLETLHSPEDEALWGLAGAQRQGFVAKGANDVRIEVLRYDQPVGRPRDKASKITDQGIMNLAIGSRSVAEVSQALDTLKKNGLVPPLKVSAGNNICAYILDRERELEFAAYPEGADDLYGFKPATIDFFGAIIK